MGLTGEIRPVTRIEQRIAEAEKLGFKQIFISKFNKTTTSNYQIEIIAVTKIEDVYGKLFV